MKLTDRQLEKFKKGICIEKGCRKPHRSKGKIRHSRCFKHLQQRYRKNHPVMASFHNMKSNAKRRGKEFTITYEYFAGIDENTNYVEKAGRTGEELSMDRIRNNEGYVEGNLQVVTTSENSSKGARCPF